VVSLSIPTRWLYMLTALGFLLVLAPLACAQDDANDVPLGDVARNLRKKPPVGQEVIDNDNLTQVMNEADSQHLSGAALLFSLDPGGKNFRVSTPDVTCSLSFNANASSLLADPISLDELPRSELMKLDGPATIDGDSLQISVHNGTQWDLRELVVGLTIVRQRDNAMNAYPGSARIFPAAAATSNQQDQDPTQKQPDVTILFHIKGAAAPLSTAVFRTPLNFELFPDQEWHWAIVRAKGVPPETSAAPPLTPTTTGTEPLPPLDRGAPDPQTVVLAPNPAKPAVTSRQSSSPIPQAAKNPALPNQ
jgi:hypothetical protein